ncbi:MAG: hypothetical protein ACPGED_03200, partial [Flavobacteriales bacterium]
LHGRIFSPTCANSGCHDGTFEPDFRTISSAYNSLVNHPVISNDATFSFVNRVTPGSASTSLLNERLTADIPNSSGIMPLEVDEDSDWDSFDQEYISRIQDWINIGAPDMFGNLPGSGNSDLPPLVEGLVVFPSGNQTTPYIRDPEATGITPIVVEAGLVDVWVRATDDNTAAELLSINELRIAPAVDELDDAPSVLFTSGSSLLAEDFSGSAVNFIHKATLDLSTYTSGQTFFLRTYFSDGVNQTVSTPNAGSNAFITSIFVIEIQ